MADKLHFDLVSPERSLRSGEVAMVVVPGTEGDFGVLAGHAPFMSTIRPGAIHVYPDSMDGPFDRIFIDGGFAEVNESGLTILAEGATPVGEIDPEAVARDLADAREDARDAKGEVDRAIAERRIARFEAMQAAATN